MTLKQAIFCAALLLLGALMPGAQEAFGKDVVLLNVSYDATRKLYTDFNEAFIKEWQAKTGETIQIKQAHSASAKQARAMLEGLRGDIVTLALAPDIDVLSSMGKLVAADWQKRLPDHSAPYTSTIVFLVRRGNPKNIRDWDDLVKAGTQVITPNPKTSGGARWNYLAAYGYALKKNGGNHAVAREFMEKLFRNVPVQVAGARGATTSFVQHNVGDVLVAWENEAHLAFSELGPGRFELVYPSMSILAEPPVSVVDRVVQRHGTAKVAGAYLDYLYSETGQEIVARHYFRPRMESVRTKYADRFPAMELFTVEEVFGGWEKAQPTHFAAGGEFDKIARRLHAR